MSRLLGHLRIIAALLLAVTSSASAQPFTIDGTLTYAGASLIPSAPPHFFLRNDGTGMAVNFPISYSAGAFHIQGLPAGLYTLVIDTDENAANPRMYPGDFYAATTFDAATAANNDLVVGLMRVIHMTAPHDNASDVYTSTQECTRPVVSTQPVQFAWDPIQAATTYDYAIYLNSCAPFQLLNAVGGSTGSSPFFSQVLAANGANDAYSLTLMARTAAGINVGILITHGAGLTSWDHRFRVVPEPRADVALAKRIARRWWWWPFSGWICTISVKNLGPSAAADVVVKDVLPADWLSAARLDTLRGAAGWACSNVGGTITCRRSTLAAGASSNFSFRVVRRVTGANRVTVSASTTDPAPNNNSAVASMYR